VFNLLPLALRSLRKLEALVDEELTAVGAPSARAHMRPRS